MWPKTHSSDTGTCAGTLQRSKLDLFQAFTPARTADRFSHLAKQMIEFRPGKSILQTIFAYINCTML